MKNTTPLRRIVIALALFTLILLGLDITTHHHAKVAFLPHFGLYLLVSVGAVLVFIVAARILAPFLSRKEDYYDR